MRASIPIRALGAILALLPVTGLPAQATAAPADVWALTNARIETVSRGTIERGTIVIRNGLIHAVGASVTPPADARIVDLNGRTVYPGIIDLMSTMGLPSTTARSGAGSGAPAAAGDANSTATWNGLDPHRVVARELKPTAADIRTARDAGITAVLVAPSRGAFRGQSALLPLRDDSASDRLIRNPVAMHMGFQPRSDGGGGFGRGQYPGTLLGVIAYERQAVYDAQRQAALQERYARNPRGMERPVYDPGTDALVPVVRGQLPVFFAADNENEIRRANRIAKEFGLRMTVLGATEGFRAIDALRGSPVVVSVDFPRTSEVTGWSYRSSQRHAPNDSAAADAEVRKRVEGNAAALHAAGIPVALASGSLRPGEFLANVRKAVAAGLPSDVALRGLTLRAAEIAGVADQLGSIEPGKIANLVVTQGPLLSDSGKVKIVFVDGNRYDVAEATSRPAAGARAASGGAVAQLGGTWSLTINSPQGEVPVTMVVNQSGTSFTGTMSSPFGSSGVTDGVINGRVATWSSVVNVQGNSINIEYRGELDDAGTRMRGTAEVGQFGPSQFTGEKRP
jgi:imidazolonepropionase-like amidohydrolase